MLKISVDGLKSVLRERDHDLQSGNMYVSIVERGVEQFLGLEYDSKRTKNPTKNMINFLKDINVLEDDEKQTRKVITEKKK